MSRAKRTEARVTGWLWVDAPCCTSRVVYLVELERERQILMECAWCGAVWTEAEETISAIGQVPP